jgi:hypothetical protein
MFSTIQIAGRVTAQGHVLRRLKDGRVEIDAGGSRFVGYPVTTPTAACKRASFRDGMLAALSHVGAGVI